MIHEIAVDPVLLARKGAEPEGFRELCRSFGLGEPRILAGIPSASGWRRLVLEAPSDGLALTRLVELCRRMTEVATFRRVSGGSGESWLELARREHGRRPFHGILASDPKGMPEGIAWQDVMGPLPGSRPQWDFPKSLSVPRGELVQRLAPLLRIARQLVFVDPFFSPASRGSVDFLIALLSEAFKNRSVEEYPLRLEIHSHRHKTKPADREKYLLLCVRELSTAVPEKARLVVRRVSTRPGGQDFHNRFLLTELGGISMGKGVAPGTALDREDVFILEGDHARTIFQRHVRLEDYDASEPPMVVK